MSRDFRDEDGDSESDYEHYARTREHSRCLWNDHGDRCTKAAKFLTTTLASKTKQLPGGPHLSVIKGGYCAQHFEMHSESTRERDIKTSTDWRDVLVDAALKARGQEMFRNGAAIEGEVKR